MSHTTLIFPPDKKPAVTHVTLPTWSEIMSDEADNGEKTVRIPTWFISLLKVSVPAILALAFMYFKVDAISKEFEEFKLEHKAVPLELIELRNKQNISELKVDNTNKDVSRSLDRIESDLKGLRVELKELSVKKP